MQVHYYVERVATRLEHASMAMKHCSQIRHYIALSKEKRIDINLKICVITNKTFPRIEETLIRIQKEISFLDLHKIPNIPLPYSLHSSLLLVLARYRSRFPLTVNPKKEKNRRTGKSVEVDRTYLLSDFPRINSSYRSTSRNTNKNKLKFFEDDRGEAIIILYIGLNVVSDRRVYVPTAVEGRVKNEIFGK